MDGVQNKVWKEQDQRNYSMGQEHWPTMSGIQAIATDGVFGTTDKEQVKTIKREQLKENTIHN